MKTFQYVVSALMVYMVLGAASQRIQAASRLGITFGNLAGRGTVTGFESASPPSVA